MMDPTSENASPGSNRTSPSIEQLRGSQERFQKLFEQSGDGIFLHDLEGILLDVNDRGAQMLEFSREELIGRPLYGLHPPGDLPAARAAFGRLLAEGFVRFRTRFTTGSGRILDVDAATAIVETAEFSVCQVVVRDITARVQAERTLEERNLFIESLLQAVPVAVFFKDREGRYLGCNQVFTEVMGVTGEEIAGKTVFELWPSDHAGVYHERDLELMRERRHQTYEFEVRDKEGRIRPVIYAKNVFNDAAGEVAGLVGAFLDITEVKRVSEGLREREEMIRALVESSRDWIWALDEQGVHTYSNPAVKEILGYEPQELAGRSIDWMHPEDREMVARMLPVWIQEKQGWKDLPIRFRHRDGSWRYLESSAVPILGPDGEVLGFRGVDRDITARRQAEEALRLFKLSVENSSDAVGMSTPGGRHYYQNRAFDEWFGDIGEDPAASLYVDPSVGREVFQTIMAGGQYTGEVEMRARDGRVLIILLRAYASRGPDGRIEALVGVHTDVTEARRLEHERRELDSRINQMQRLESLGVLAGGIAHDFNNILMAILGHAELVLEELSPQASGRESVQEIRQAALSAAELCTQMLAYSGKGCLEKRDFCLGRLVGEMVHMLRASISKKCVLNLVDSKELPAMHGDVSQVRQVILNLVINASESLGELGGSITVTTGVMDQPVDQLAQGFVVQVAAPGPYVFVEVSDTGCGMSSETVSRMFEPFFTTKFTGRGLGLSAVLGIVQAHGGALRVQSDPGRGTTIRVLFPVAGQAAAPDEAKSGCANRAGRGTVLVVDDEAAVLGVTCKMLRRLGFDVLTARDGLEALETYRERRAGIALVLMDLTMPRMGGEEALAELRRMDPQVRVVLASGYDEHDIATRFSGKGLAGSIQKPYTLQKLAEVLEARLPGTD